MVYFSHCSKTGASERAMVIGLGGLNLFGVIILGAMLKDYSIMPSGFIKFVADIFPLLQKCVMWNNCRKHAWNKSIHSEAIGSFRL
ncbi:hypothetical protein SAY87_027373 [Trapa incisa]|uniref:Uncharacterized protein n=1 Tax=Trapa incisa TaxID=236973 RepID=A0AAN7H2A8_9MYRT|nr:hypothetical protein SAY87_027373 [Trapa incisa]